MANITSKKYEGVRSKTLNNGDIAYASHLAIKGVPIQIIQKLLNHKDIKMAMRYARLMPQSGKEYVENLWS